MRREGAHDVYGRGGDVVGCVVGGVGSPLVVDAADGDGRGRDAGGGTIGQMLLDVADRGRSLGIILVGARPTASQVEERVVVNAAIQLGGRLEACKAKKDSYGHDDDFAAAGAGTAGGLLSVSGLGYAPQ